ncbi:MAG: hypothetical protein AAGG09_20730, partial [Pseudomonadota bacterium]
SDGARRTERPNPETTPPNTGYPDTDFPDTGPPPNRLDAHRKEIQKTTASPQKLKQTISRS